MKEIFHVDFYSIYLANSALVSLWSCSYNCVYYGKVVTEILSKLPIHQKEATKNLHFCYNKHFLQAWLEDIHHNIGHGKTKHTRFFAKIIFIRSSKLLIYYHAYQLPMDTLIDNWGYKLYWKFRTMPFIEHDSLLIFFPEYRVNYVFANSK